MAYLIRGRGEGHGEGEGGKGLRCLDARHWRRVQAGQRGRTRQSPPHTRTRL